jgi:hypothetical protein
MSKNEKLKAAKKKAIEDLIAEVDELVCCGIITATSLIRKLKRAKKMAARPE